MLKLKVIKVGNSAGVVLPKEVLSHLDVENGDEVFLTATEGGGYNISPLDPGFERQMTLAKRGIMVPKTSIMMWQIENIP